MATFYGADVSEFQGIIDWQAFNPGAAFVWIKGSGGDGVDNPLYVDAQLANNKAGVRALGNAMPRGFYHFAGGRDAVEEANYFVDNVCSDLQVGEAVALDWEKELSDPVSWCKQWKDHVENRLGFHVVFYVDTDRLKRYDFSPVLSTSALWEANYEFTPEQSISGSPIYTFHQYRDNGTFPGINGNVDVDAFFAEHITDFFRLGKPALAVPAPVFTPELSVTPVEPSQPTVDAQSEPGTIVQPEQPPKTPTSGTAIDVVVNPPKPKPVEGVPKSTEAAVVNKPNEVKKVEGSIMKLGRYNKFLIALGGAILTFLAQKYGTNEIVRDAVLVATALGVLQVGNTPIESGK